MVSKNVLFSSLNWKRYYWIPWSTLHFNLNSPTSFSKIQIARMVTHLFFGPSGANNHKKITHTTILADKLNLNNLKTYQPLKKFIEDPNFIDPLLDTSDPPSFLTKYLGTSSDRSQVTVVNIGEDKKSRHNAIIRTDTITDAIAKHVPKSGDGQIIIFLQSIDQVKPDIVKMDDLFLHLICCFYIKSTLK